MMWQLMQEAFEVDGRIVRSLRLLLFTPGGLSEQFSANRRADYISPIRLYIFTSLLFFAVVSLTAEPLRVSTPTQAIDEIEIQLEEEDNQENIETFLNTLTPETERDMRAVLEQRSWTRYIALGYISAVMEDGVVRDIPAFQFLSRQVARLLTNPERAVDQFQDQMPIALFFLLPAYALLLKIVYLRANTYFVEHFVFALHLHAFAFLVFTLLALLPEGRTWAGALEGVVYLLLLAYYFLALRRYYRQGRLKTLFKFSILLASYSALVVPAGLLVMAATFATY